jgi:transposase-like protein
MAKYALTIKSGSRYGLLEAILVKRFGSIHSGVKILFYCHGCGRTFTATASFLGTHRSCGCLGKKTFRGKKRSYREIAEMVGLSEGAVKQAFLTYGEEGFEKYLQRRNSSRLPTVGTVINGRELVEVAATTRGYRKVHRWRCKTCGDEVQKQTPYVKKHGCQRCENVRRTRRTVTICGEDMSLAELSSLYEVNYYRLHDRLANGWTLPQALSLHPPPGKEKK